MLRNLCHRTKTIGIRASRLRRSKAFSAGPTGNVYTASGKLLPEDWVRSVLSGFSPDPIEAIKKQDGKSCLINNVEEKMSYPFIDVDGKFPSTIKEIEDALLKKPDPRGKPLLATVKGTGGGKTRLFEEIRRSLNQRDDTVVIGVTFNNKTHYNETREMPITGVKFFPLNLLLSVMTRITAVVYGQELYKCEGAFYGSIEQLDYEVLANSRVLPIFFRSFLNAVIDSLAASDQTGKLKNVVFLVDEVMRLLDENLAEDATAKKQEITNEFKSFLSALNQGVLDERLCGAAGREWNATLLVSSLEVSALKKTTSGRKIGLLPTGVLGSKEVVEGWWRKDLSIESSGVATAKLQLVAEVLKSLPRIVESAEDFLAGEAKGSSSANPLKIHARMIKRLFEHVLKEIPKRYSLSEDVDPRKTFALVFGEKLDLDSESIALMRNSYFVNTLNKIKDSEKIVQKFVPEGNLAMLAYYDLSAAEKEFSEVEADWNDPKMIFVNVFRAVVDSICSGAEGDALENVTRGWLLARLIAAHRAGIKDMPLHEFLAIPDLFDAPEAIRVEIPARISSKRKVYDDQALVELSAISENATNAARDFNKIDLRDKAHAFVMKTGHGQNFDHMVVFRIAGTDELFIVFIDNKSKRVPLGKPSAGDPKAMELDVAQFYRVEELVEELRKLEESRTELSAISQALVKGNWRFIYTTSHPKVELQRNGKELEEKPERLVLMTSKETKSFFGIIWDWYRAARGMYDKTQTKNKKKKNNNKNKEKNKKKEDGSSE